MPPIHRYNLRPRRNAPLRRSERIRLRTVAAARAARAARASGAARAARAAGAAETARQASQVLPSRATNRTRGSRRNRAAVGSSDQPNRQGPNLALQNILRTSGVRDFTNRARGSQRNRATVGSSAQPSRQGPNLALQNFLRTSRVRESTPPPAADAPTTPEAALPSSSLMSGLTRGETRPLTSRQEPPTRAIERIKRDMLNFQKERPEGCDVEMDENDIFRWKATIQGPPGTPYEGGIFHLILLFHQDYPFLPPKVYFETKMYHCNVASSGNVCVDILSSEWSPALTVGKMLLSIISLLSDPNPEDPLQPILGDLCKRRRDVYDANARLWTQKYAMPKAEDQAEK